MPAVHLQENSKLISGHVAEKKGYLYWVLNPVSYTHLDVYKRQLLVGPQDVVWNGGEVCTLPSGEEVNFYQVIPLYRNEMEYKMEHDAVSYTHLDVYKRQLSMKYPGFPVVEFRMINHRITRIFRKRTQNEQKNYCCIQRTTQAVSYTHLDVYKRQL